MIKFIRTNYLDILSIMYLLFVTTRISSFWVEQQAYFDIDESSGNFIVSIIGVLYLFLVIFNRERLLFTFSTKNKKIIFCFLLYALLSVSWALMPYISFRRWLKIFIIVLVTINIQRDPKKFLYILLIYISIVTISSLILIVFLPKYGYTNYYGVLLPQGVMGHKNFLGLFSSIAIIILPFIYWGLKQYKYLILFLLFVNLSFFILSDSKTAQTALISSYIISSFILFSIKRKFIMSLFLTLLILFQISITLAGVQYQELYSSFLYYIGKDPTFTGRVELWQALISIASSYRFLNGFGFKSFFLGSNSSWLVNYLPWEAPSAHSDYITVFLELGLIGLILMVVFLIASYYNILLKLKNNFQYYYMLVILNFFIVESVTEIHFFNTTILFVFLIIAKTYRTEENHEF